MPRNRQPRDTEKSRKEHIEIAIEKARTEDVKKLKTLDELMKEKR